MSSKDFPKVKGLINSKISWNSGLLILNALRLGWNVFPGVKCQRRCNSDSLNMRVEYSRTPAAGWEWMCVPEVGIHISEVSLETRAS